MCGVGFLLETIHIEGGYFSPADFGWVVGLGRVNDDGTVFPPCRMYSFDQITLCASLFRGLADKI